MKRKFLFFAGVVTAGFGVALSTQAGLGATPISSFPWVLTFLTPLSYGTLTLFFNLLMVAAQSVILRRRFRLFQLLQIPVTALFGACIDLGMWMTGPLVTGVWPLQVLMLASGAFVLASGIVMQVRSEFLCIPGDALVKVISQEWRYPLSKVKMAFDGSLVAFSAVISYLATGGLEGIREGTLMSVFLVGGSIGLITRLIPVSRSANKSA